MSFLEIASRTPSLEAPVSTPSLVVVSIPHVAVIPQGMCQAPNCPRKALPDEVFCFDCHVRSDRHCAEFATCGRYRFGEGPRCRKCQRNFDRRCERFEICGNLAAIDHQNNRPYPTCGSCYSEQMELDKRCPYFDECGGYRRVNAKTGERYPTCPGCASENA